MKYFTKFLCLFLGAAMMLTMAACGSKSDTDANAGADGEKKQLVVATSPDFPPFEFLDGSQIVGIEPALMQAIADKLGMELVWEQVDFDSIIPGIQAERYDVGAAGITITPDRQKFRPVPPPRNTAWTTAIPFCPSPPTTTPRLP